MAPRRESRSGRSSQAQLRIIGGRFGGRLIRYDGDPATRPMKERIREAAFNLLGPAVVGKAAIDLFAGTGAMGLEALSRGATQATLIERRFPTARTIEENVATLGVADRVRVVAADALVWVQRDLTSGEQPLVVFCCPPYDFSVDRRDAMIELIATLVARAAPGSLLLVESDNRFNIAALPDSDAWDVRRYPPAVIAILEIPNPKS